jgi:CheY-like chemotaxis protein
LTADAMSGDRDRFMAMGVSGYVSKPIDRAELLTEIGRVLGVGPLGVPKQESHAADATESFDDVLGELDRIATAR